MVLALREGTHFIRQLDSAGLTAGCGSATEHSCYRNNYDMALRGKLIIKVAFSVGSTDVFKEALINAAAPS